MAAGAAIEEDILAVLDGGRDGGYGLVPGVARVLGSNRTLSPIQPVFYDNSRLYTIFIVDIRASSYYALRHGK